MVKYRYVTDENGIITAKKQSDLDPIRARHIKENIKCLPKKYFNGKLENGSFILCFEPGEVPLLPVFDRVLECARRRTSL